jgi:hypothetical protein
LHAGCSAMGNSTASPCKQHSMKCVGKKRRLPFTTAQHACKVELLLQRTGSNDVPVRRSTLVSLRRSAQAYFAAVLHTTSSARGSMHTDNMKVCRPCSCKDNAANAAHNTDKPFQRPTGSVGPSSMKGVRPAPLRSTASLPRGAAPHATSSCCSGRLPAARTQCGG